ncbi:(2Fe-2S)-binding protein [Streptomyces sp. NPDC002156]
MTYAEKTVTDALSGLGPLFGTDVHAPDAIAAPPWHQLGELAGNRAALRHWVLQVGRELAALGGIPGRSVDPKAAASLAHLGLVARLIAPALALAVRTGQVLDLNLASTWWQPVLGGPVPLSIPVPSAPPPAQPGNDRVAALMSERVIDGPVRELTAAVEELGVSPRVLWGNVASVVNSAASLLTEIRPEESAKTRHIAAALMRRPPLGDAGTVDEAGRFQRLSCCLLHQVTPGERGPVCGDCVLVRDTSE